MRRSRILIVDDDLAIVKLVQAGLAHRGFETLAATEGKCRLYMSIINLGEVMYIVERERGLPKAQETLARIDELPIEIVDADRNLTLAAAHLKTHWSIAYADCFAAALSQIKSAPLVTRDPEFSKVKPSSALQVEWPPSQES